MSRDNFNDNTSNTYRNFFKTNLVLKHNLPGQRALGFRMTILTNLNSVRPPKKKLKFI